MQEMCVATSMYVFFHSKSTHCSPYLVILTELSSANSLLMTLQYTLCSIAEVICAMWVHCSTQSSHSLRKTYGDHKLPACDFAWYMSAVISVKSPGSIHLTAWVMSYKVSIKSSHIAIFIFQQYHTLFCTNILVNHAVNLLWLNIINNAIIYIFHKAVFGTDKLSDINMKYPTMHSGFYTIPYTIQLMTIGIGNLAAHF